MINTATEPLFKINLDTRIITVPDEFKTNGVGVTGDHKAETLWFECANSFDDFSLNDPNTEIIIQYKNALGEQGVFNSTDIINEINNNIIKFSWVLDSFAMMTSGTLMFNIRFLHKTDDTIDRIINTQPASLIINTSLNFDDEIALQNIDNYDYETSIISVDIQNNSMTIGNFNYNENNCYEINLDERTITPPDFLGVTYDHNVHTIYFKCNQEFDDINLKNGGCMIQYINTNGEQGYYIVPSYKIINNQLILPWKINGLVTAYSGIISFNIRFYKTQIRSNELDQNDPNNYYYLYNLETQPTQSKILTGLNLSLQDFSEYYKSVSVQEITGETIQQIIQETQSVWIDL